MLSPAVREQGEAYATAAQILACQDIPEADIRVPFWRGADGKPLLMRVRGLDFDAEEAIDLAATKKDGTTDGKLVILGILERGILVPKMTKAQIAQLGEKNPHAVKQLAEFIHVLNQFNQEQLE